jgi:hypothetical protein
MSALALAFMIASGPQGGTAHPAQAAAHDTLFVIVLILAMAAAAALIIRHVLRRPKRRGPVSDQWQALAVMGELCPHGWKAQITLYGWGAPVPDDAPQSRAPLVELEWKLFDEDSGSVAVARRVWAPSIGEALQTMVEDRRTDVTLEEIERSAAEREDLWWND